MADMTPFHAEKCCRLARNKKRLLASMQQRPPVPDLQYIRTCSVTFYTYVTFKLT